MAYSESAYRAAKKYREKNIKRVPLDVQISQYEAMQVHANSRGETINGFIKRAIRETIERDKEKAGD